MHEELFVLCKLDHPYICRYTESFEDEKYMYIVMEYVEDAIDLEHLISNRVNECNSKELPILPEDEVRRLMYMLLRGIHHMHMNGIIHRDLKPENCLLDKSLNLRIIDFGLAKVTDNDKTGK